MDGAKASTLIGNGEQDPLATTARLRISGVASSVNVINSPVDAAGLSMKDTKGTKSPLNISDQQEPPTIAVVKSESNLDTRPI